jgi:hypothetical protein
LRIERTTGAGAATSGKQTQKASTGEFTLGSAETASGPLAAGSSRSIGGIDILMALQGVESPTERRRRAVARGRSALDVLDEIKLGLLNGDISLSTVSRLKAAVAGIKDGSGDPALDEVLAEIELRLEVELAKLEPVPGR